MTDAASPRSRSSAAARRQDKEKAPAAKIAPRKRREALRVAEALFRQRPDWMTFFHEVLGVEGALPRLFPDPDELAAFEQTSEYAAIQGMLGELRREAVSRLEAGDKEPIRMITVRLPKSMHEALRAEAQSRKTSINKLCITKLLRALEALPEAEEPPSKAPKEQKRG